jgi:MoaA/NifB/PqqE/SkfB family radical SAM enzyme
MSSYLDISTAKVGIELTNRCNMRCRMCGQWGASGHHLEREGFLSVDLAVAKRFVDQVAPLGVNLTLWGGEPLITSAYLIPMRESLEKKRSRIGLPRLERR